MTFEPDTVPVHEPGGTYDTALQEDGSMDILDSDDNGNEFPAKPGWYFKQFVRRGQDWMSVNGWFGPYVSIDAMPDHVRSNLTELP